MSARPVVFDYDSPHKFLQDLLAHYKETSNFSIRQRTQMAGGCSPALVSQVLTGRRRLTRDQIPTFARLFKLQDFEIRFLDQPEYRSATDERRVPRAPRKSKNHLLSNWLNVYVKDLVNLKGFSLEPVALRKMLFGIASEKKIQKSIEYLLAEGFWRKTATRKIIAEEPAVVSTNELPNEKIRSFHKQALRIALRGLDVFPSDRRKSSTVLIACDREKIVELKEMIDGFQAQLLQFIEDHPCGGDDLIQVAVHLTPVGAKNA